jgi:hypothetical protein
MCRRGEDHPALTLERAHRGLGNALVLHAFNELIRAKEQQRIEFQRYNLPAPPDPPWLAELLGRKDS